jgi:NtrC-family two-component system response regulator AlgB
MVTTDPPRAARPGLRVLVVDDERNIRATLAVCLEGEGCAVAQAATGAEALAAAARERFDLAFLDLRLAAESGLDLLPKLVAACPGVAIVVVTAYATIDTAVEAMRRGAWDYLGKPFTPAQIRHVVARVAERRELASRIDDLERRVAEASPETDLATDSPKMRAVLDTAWRAAASDASLLLRGESGTGKGVLARAIHARSPRTARPFATVNCPTLTDELLASELFGHAKGAFTGAVRDQPGRVEAAEGGTLFLDEVAEMSPALQAKLLRFVQDKEFERVGETRTRRADVRVIAATNRDLDAEVAAGRFRRDLFFRLDVIELVLPPLRERPEDVVRLANGFLAFFARAAARPAQELSPAAADVCRRYAWPGNVRELRNAMERVSILWPARTVEPSALPERMVPADVRAAEARRVELGGPHTIDEVEREHVLRVLATTPTLDEAARVLGIDASTLWRKRKRYEQG